MSQFTVIASEYAHLDSNVYTGGGTNDTAVIQRILDQAPEMGGLHLIMDGAALISGLKVHSNTTIECVNKDCGFYLADGTNGSLLSNANESFTMITDRNICLIGGTYNHNARNQLHDTAVTEEDSVYSTLDPSVFGGRRWSIGFEFFGVEGLTIDGITLSNQRTFGMLIANWKHVRIQDVRIDLPEKMVAQNQDGIHFWGPGRHLYIQNIFGNAGDDFIALAPDEYDCVSDITDVVIDGVVLDEADQGIRLLSRGNGRLDRVIIRNVTGTYKDFGFFINPWFYGEKTKGNIGHVTIENVDLVQSEHKYLYSVPFLFRLGGMIEKLTLKNIRHVSLTDEHTFLQIGGYYDCESRKEPCGPSKVGTVEIDGLELVQAPGGPLAKGIEVKCEVDTVIVRNAILHNMGKHPFVKVFDGGSVKNVMLSQIVPNGTTLVEDKNMIGRIFKTDICE